MTPATGQDGRVVEDLLQARRPIPSDAPGRGRPIGELGGPKPGGAEDASLRCAHSVRRATADAVDRLLAVRPPRGLQGGAPHGTARGRQANRSAADARQLPEGALGQHPRSVQGGVRGAGRIVPSNPSAGKGAKAKDWPGKAGADRWSGRLPNGVSLRIARGGRPVRDAGRARARRLPSRARPCRPFPSFPGRGRAAERAHRRVRLVYAGKALARDGKRNSIALTLGF
jgi:hypothetical protein